jgi:Protein of unknown function (DUF2917)
MLHLTTSEQSRPATLREWAAWFMRKPVPEAWCGVTTVQVGQPVRFVCPANICVTCLSGTAWITTAADIRDVVLVPGQRHVASRRDRLFINGMPRCVLRFDPASPAQRQPIPPVGAQPDQPER